MRSDPPQRSRKLLILPPPTEEPETQAFIDRYLELADKLLTPNLERQWPDQKTEPYIQPEEHARRRSFRP